MERPVSVQCDDKNQNDAKRTLWHRRVRRTRRSPVSDESTTTLPTRPHHRSKAAPITPEQSESGAADVRRRLRQAPLA